MKAKIAAQNWQGVFPKLERAKQLAFSTIRRADEKNPVSEAMAKWKNSRNF